MTPQQVEMARHHVSQGRSAVRGQGIAIFAGLIMIMLGFFQALEGLAAIFNNNFFFVTPNYTFSYDVTTWGWVHFIVGAVVFLAGFGVFSGKLWARAIGITVAIISAIANFLFLPYYPFWSILMIALNVVVIYGLSIYRTPKEEEMY